MEVCEQRSPVDKKRRAGVHATATCRIIYKVIGRLGALNKSYKVISFLLLPGQSYCDCAAYSAEGKLLALVVCKVSARSGQLLDRA